MTLLGNLALWLAFLLAGWSTVAGALGTVQAQGDLLHSADRALRTATAALVVASLALGGALVTHDFNVAYVAAHGSRTASWWYRVAALYCGGPAGALLSYATSAGVCATLGLTLGDDRTEDYRWGAVIASGILTLAGGVLVLGLHPFARLPFTPVDGGGIAPQLQQSAAALAPLFTYLAAAALIVPMVSAAGALASGSLSDGWVVSARRWAASAWILATGGGLLETWARYVVPRPTASAGDLGLVALAAVWIVATAVQHATTVEQRRDEPPRWSLALALAGGVLAMLAAGIMVSGRFAPRISGAPLGAFAASAAVGLWWWSRRRPLRATKDHSIAAAPRAAVAWSVAAHVGHAGAVLIVAAVLGMGLSRGGRRIELRPAESFAVDGPAGLRFRLTYLGTSQYERDNELVTAATLELARAGRRLGMARAERLEYADVMGRPLGGPSGRAAIWRGLAADVRVVLVKADRSRSDTAVLRVALYPLAWGTWVGGCLLLLAGVLAAQVSFRSPSRPPG